MGKKVLLYCDPCASDNGLVIQNHKRVKSTCQLCHRFIGPLNEVIEEDVVPNDIPAESIKVGSFEIQQLPNFMRGMPPKDIYPTLPYTSKSQDLIIYFPSLEDDEEGRKTLIIANPYATKTHGEQFRIILPGARRTTLAGKIEALD